MTRTEAIDRFLRGQGLPTGRSVLAEDASFRRYWRLADGLVLMDAPPEAENVRPFLAVQAHLAVRGLSVPALRAAEPDLGLVLLEDFGDGLFPAVMRADNLIELYDAAVDALAHLHKAAVPADLPVWGPQEMAAAAAATFLDWWWPARFAGAPPRDAFGAA